MADNDPNLADAAEIIKSVIRCFRDGVLIIDRGEGKFICYAKNLTSKATIK